MGITQNEVVWNQNTGGRISLCTVIFAIIAKNTGIAKIEIFAMHSTFRYHSEILFAIIAKIRYDSENSLL